MFHYVVPVDDQPHEFRLTHDPAAVATLAIDIVEFWAEHDGTSEEVSRVFQVFGTGHPLPPGARHTGTAPRTEEGLVWHLYELMAVTP